MQKKILQCGVEMAISALVLITTSVSATANWSYGSPYHGWYGGNGYYSNYCQESVPYYALNPPVYYSYHVARTYGLYPFPYYADATPSPAVAIEPKLVINKYVEQKLTAESDSLERQPLRIANPFVEQPAESKSVEKASWDNSKTVKPKVIYPIKLTSAK